MLKRTLPLLALQFWAAGARADSYTSGAALNVGATPVAGGSTGQFLTIGAGGVLGSSASGASIAFPQAATGATSGSVVCATSTTSLSTSVTLAANALLIGGGAGACPSSTTSGAGVLAALGNAANGAGGVVTSPVANGNLANSSITINGVAASLGGFYTIPAAAGTLTGATLASGVTGSSLTSVGTITSGVWNGSIISVANGGTGTATPGLVSGTNVTIGGTWPNQTINATGVSFAASTDVQAGTSSALAVTPAALSGSAAAQTLTYASTISWNVASGYNAAVTLAGSGATVSSPTNVIPGLTYTLQVAQDATGSRTLASWGAAFDWGVAGTPALSTTANAIDLVSCIAASGPKLLCTINKGF